MAFPQHNSLKKKKHEWELESWYSRSLAVNMNQCGKEKCQRFTSACLVERKNHLNDEKLSQRALKVKTLSSPFH